MKTKIKNIILFILASLIIGFVCAEETVEDASKGVSKINITNYTPYEFHLTFIPGVQSSRDESTRVFLIRANEKKALTAFSGTRLAYKGSDLVIEAIGAENPDKFKEVLDWRSNPLMFGLGFYKDGAHTSVTVKLEYKDKDNLQMDITEGDPLRSPQEYQALKKPKR